MKPNVLLTKSSIDKLGVFAARDFKKGETVMAWHPIKILSKEEAERLPSSEKHFVSNYREGEYVLQSEPERYVNHSCDPNTHVIGMADVAKKNIKKGEEITSDYSDGGLFHHFECTCGSKNCRKYI
jgi:SET domain-containing protein